MEIQGKKFEVNKEDKLFYPEENYTKKDVMNYYQKISSFMLPHLKDRAVTMIRYPDGAGGKRFFQKNTPDYFPEWIKTKALSKKEGGKVNYVVVEDEATLVYLASQASLAIHIWLSKIQHPNKPDKLIFDLDPSKDDFEEVKEAAKLIRKFFWEKLNMETFLMTTGSSGLHVVLPIKPEMDFEEVLKLSQEMSEYLVKLYPEKFTTAIKKDKRENKIYLDVLRNSYGQTSVAPYSLRARPEAPVATPMDWEELSGLKSAKAYTMANIFKRLAKKEDPWKNIYKNPVSPIELKKEFENL